MARMEHKRGVYTVLVGRHGRNRPLGRRKHRWEVILKCIFKKWDEGRHELDRSGSGKGQVNAGMNVRVP